MRTKMLLPPLLVLLAVSCYGTARSGHLGSAERALAKNDCEAALSSVGTAESLGTPSQQELVQISFIRAQCFDRMGRLDDALGLYEYVAENDPSSPSGFRARERARAIRESLRMR